MAFRPSMLNVKLNVLAKGFQKGMGQASGSLSKFAAKTKAIGASTGSIFKKMGMAAAALGGAMFLAGRSAAKFEHQMAFVSTMVKDTDKWMGTLTEGVQDLSIAFGQSTETMAQGLYSILSAGVPVADSLKVLEQSAKAATAGFTEVGTASKAMVGIMNAMGIGFDQVERVSDILFKTVEKGIVTFEELASNMADVTVAANKSDVALEEISAAMATLTRSNVNAARANISLARALEAIETPADQAVEAAERLGIEMGEAVLAGEGLLGFLRQLAEKDVGSEVIKELFPEKRARLAIDVLLAKFKEFERDVKDVYSDVGATARALAKAQDTFEFKWNKAKQAFIAFWRTFGKAILPALTTIVERVTDKIATLTSAMDNLGGSTGKASNKLTWMESVFKWVEKAAIKITEWITKAGLAILKLGDILTLGLTDLGKYVSESWDMMTEASKAAIDEVDRYYDEVARKRAQEIQKIEKEAADATKRKPVAPKKMTPEEIERAAGRRRSKREMKRFEEMEKFEKLFLADRIKMAKEYLRRMKELGMERTEEFKAMQEKLFNLEKEYRKERLDWMLGELDKYAEFEFKGLEDAEVAKARLKVRLLKEYLKNVKMTNKELVEVYKQLKEAEFELEKAWLERMKKINEDYQHDKVAALEEWIQNLMHRYRLAEAGSKEEAKIEAQITKARRMQIKQELKDAVNLAKKKGSIADEETTRYERLTAASMRLEEIMKKQGLTDKERAQIAKVKAKIDREAAKEEAKERAKAEKQGIDFDKELKKRAQERAEELTKLAKKNQEEEKSQAEKAKEAGKQAADTVKKGFKEAGEAVKKATDEMAKGLEVVAEKAKYTSGELVKLAKAYAEAYVKGGPQVQIPKMSPEATIFLSKAIRHYIEKLSKELAKNAKLTQKNDIKVGPVNVNVKKLDTSNAEEVGEMIGDGIAQSVANQMGQVRP